MILATYSGERCQMGIMRRVTKSKMLRVGVAAAALGMGVVAAGAAPASAATTLVLCRTVMPIGTYSDSAAKCAKVIGISSGDVLGARVSPHYSSPIVYGYKNGAWAEVDGCWTTGDGAPDNTSYKIWDRVYSGLG